jgi:hypothetical protein
MRYTGAILALTLVSYGALAQQTMPPDRVFTLHSRADGQCPPLDWHIGVDDEAHTLSGVLGWGQNMASLARVNGTFNPTTRNFEMKATEVGGQNRTAEITGQVRNDGWLVANVSGAVTCNNITIPWFHPNAGVNR